MNDQEIHEELPKRAIGQLSFETRQIMNLIREVAVGVVVTYKELSDLIGRDVQGEARHCMQSARWILLRDEKLKFDVVVDVGLKRLNNEETFNSRHRCESAIRSQVKLGLATLAAVEYGLLTNEQQLKYNVSTLALKLSDELQKDKTQTRLLGAVNTGEQLSLEKTVKALESMKIA